MQFALKSLGTTPDGVAERAHQVACVTWTGCPAPRSMRVRMMCCFLRQGVSCGRFAIEHKMQLQSAHVRSASCKLLLNTRLLCTRMHIQSLACHRLSACSERARSASAAPAKFYCTASSGGKSHRKKAGRPGQFEVKVVSPPPRTLGIHTLPPDTHNGDQIEVEGQDYVVDSVTLHYRLVGGKYERDHNQLAVQSTSRYILNKYLDQLYTKGNSQ